MNLYLMEILGQMNFIDKEILKGPCFNNTNDRYRKLKVLLRSQNTNLLVVSNQDDYPQDIEKNLFKVLCAIFNLKPNQKGLYVMDEELLEQYCEQIETSKFNTDETFIAQISVLKSLINRKTYMLTDKQVGMIHKKYKNFCI